MTSRAQTREDMLREFHERFAFPSQDPRYVDSGVTHELRSIAQTVETLANQIEESSTTYMNDFGDGRLYRAHLMLEELSELLDAMAKMDEVEIADAVADLSYVVEGTGVHHNIPTEAVFHEVHRSNMTKRRSKDDTRMRSKDSSHYSPPRIQEILDSRRLIRR